MSGTRERAKDEIWKLRKVLSPPCFAVLKMMAIKSPRTTRELYDELGRKFTRKTLILTIRSLSLDMSVIKAEHIRDNRGYIIGYSMTTEVIEVVRDARKLEKLLESLGAKTEEAQKPRGKKNAR